MIESKCTEEIQYGCVELLANSLSPEQKDLNKTEMLQMIQESGCMATVEEDREFVVFYRTGTPELHSVGSRINLAPIKTFQEASAWRQQQPGLYDYVCGPRSAFIEFTMDSEQ